MQIKHFLKHSCCWCWLMIVISIFCTCTNQSNKLETALSLAGENRSILKQVLDNYQDDPLKCQAACFLIANMPYHYTYDALQIDSMKILKINAAKGGKLNDSILSYWSSYDYTTSNKKYDIEHISSRLIIENIDYAFKAWNSRPWNKKYSFLEFCQFVLPHRISDEPLCCWRRIYYEKYNKVLDSLYHGNDVIEAARVLAKYLKKEGFCMQEDFNLPHLGADFLFKNRIGTCREQCDIAVYVMRSVGIPIALDFYKISPSYNSTHYWTAIIDTNRLAVPFNYTEKEIDRNAEFERKLGKVYRINYNYFSFNQMKKENVPYFNQPFVSDVSYEYFPHSSVYVRVNNKLKSSILYLSISSGEKYKPIAYASNRNNGFLFPFVEPNLIYFPTTFGGSNLVPAYFPFLLVNNKTFYFVPNQKRKITVNLTRKYPLLKGRNFIKSIQNVQVWGYACKNDKDSVLLCKFTQMPRSNYIKVPILCSKKIRYIKYLASGNKRIELGEFYAFNNCDTIVPRKVSSSLPLDKIHEQNLGLMQDGDWESFYMSAQNGEQLTFDYGKRQNITSILVIPRNDDNYIHLGDTYELYFHNGKDGWISLGKKIADKTNLVYNNVPSNSVLWLHNLTRGKEERPFYIKKGKQVFP